MQPQVPFILTQFPWMKDFRSPQGSIIYWVDGGGNIGLTGLYFADGTIQTTAAFGSNTNVVQSFSTNTVITITTAQNLTIKAAGGAGGITLTLPSAVGITGQRIKIFKSDTAAGSVTINTVSGQTMNGSNYGTSYALLDAYQSIEVESDGSNWLARTSL